MRTRLLGSVARPRLKTGVTLARRRDYGVPGEPGWAGDPEDASIRRAVAKEKKRLSAVISPVQRLKERVEVHKAKLTSTIAKNRALTATRIAFSDSLHDQDNLLR